MSDRALSSITLASAIAEDDLLYAVIGGNSRRIPLSVLIDSTIAEIDYTAADVLAKLLTVDGAGSGLDADLLDGQSSAYYATASGLSSVVSDLAAHLADTADAHDASAISFSATGALSSTDVQAALAELDSEKQPGDADLTALAALASTGFAARTGSNTWAQRSLTAPAAGLSITNPAGIAGDPTFALANDLAALEGLGSTGFAVRSATDTWVQRSVAVSGAGLSVSNGDGVSGNPTISLADDVAAIEALSPSNDDVLQRKAGAWTNRTIAQLLADLAAPGTTFQPLDSDLTSWAGVTRAAGFDTFVATPSSANLKSLVSDETGSGALVFANTPTLVTPEIGAATGTSLVLSSGAGLQIGSSVPFSDAAGTLTLANIDALDATTEATIEAAIDTLANLGSIQGVAFTFGAYAATLLNNTNEAAFKAAVNLEIGTDVQAYDAELAALAGLTSAADRLPYFTGSGTAALATFTSFGRSLVDDADQAAAQATIGYTAADVLSKLLTVDGAGSLLDADFLDGKTTGTSGNTIPLLDGTNTWSGAQTIAASTGAALNHILEPTGWLGLKHRLGVQFAGDELVLSNNAFLASATTGDLDNTSQWGAAIILGSAGSFNFVRASFGSNPRTFTSSMLIDGAVVINDDGADADFRVEGDTDANLFFLDASADNIGIGTGTPSSSYKLDIAGAGGLQVTTSNASAHYALNVAGTVSGNYVRSRIKNNSSSNNSTVGNVWEIGVSNGYTTYELTTGTGTPSALFFTGSGVTGGLTFQTSAGDITFSPTGNLIGKTPASTADDSTKLATTAWVQDVVAAAVIGAGAGDVVGPASATDNALVRFDATTGKLIQNSGAILDDSNNLTGIAALTATGNISFDGGSLVFNESGADKDARFEGDTDANLWFLDASTDRAGIGTNTPSHKLDVAGNIGISTSGYINARGTDGSSGYGYRINSGAMQYKNSGGGWGDMVPFKHAVADFGFVGDDSTNNDTPISTMITWLNATGGYVYFPHGVYRYNSAWGNITGAGGIIGAGHIGNDAPPNGLTLSGAYGTIFRSTSATADSVNLNAAAGFYVGNCCFWPSAVKTAGREIDAYNTFGCIIDRVLFYCAYEAVHYERGSDLTLRDVRIRYNTGPYGIYCVGASGATQEGVHLINVITDNPWPNGVPAVDRCFSSRSTSTAYNLNDAIIHGGKIWQCMVGGTTSGSSADFTLPNTNSTSPYTTNVVDGTAEWRFVCDSSLTWLWMDGYSYTFNLYNCHFLHGYTGIRAWDTISAANDSPRFFLGVDVEIEQSYGDCISLKEGSVFKLTTGYVAQSLTGNGINIAGTYGGDVEIASNTIKYNALHGVTVAAGPTEIDIHHNKVYVNGQLTNNTYQGINIADSVEDFRITNNTSGRGEAGLSGRQQYGVRVGSSCGNFIVAQNSVRGNVTDGVNNNSSTSSTKIVSNNIS